MGYPDSVATRLATYAPDVASQLAGLGKPQPYFRGIGGELMEFNPIKNDAGPLYFAPAELAGYARGFFEGSSYNNDYIQASGAKRILNEGIFWYGIFIKCWFPPAMVSRELEVNQKLDINDLLFAESIESYDLSKVAAQDPNPTRVFSLDEYLSAFFTPAESTTLLEIRRSQPGNLKTLEELIQKKKHDRGDLAVHSIDGLILSAYSSDPIRTAPRLHVQYTNQNGFKKIAIVRIPKILEKMSEEMGYDYLQDLENMKIEGGILSLRTKDVWIPFAQVKQETENPTNLKSYNVIHHFNLKDPNFLEFKNGDFTLNLP